jgi:hypothetical protein
MYYVYSYLREDYSPYYIGKGCKDRAYAYSNHRIKAPKDRARIYIIKNNLTENEAYEVEKLYILMFGRKDLGTGILRNLSDGGEGPTGYKTTPEQRRKISLSRMGEKHPLYGVSPSEETREKQRQSLKGKYVKEKNPMYGKTHSEEARKAISKRHKGIPKSEEHRRKISEANKGKTISEETRKKISETNKLSGNKSFLGKKHSEETKKKISESKKGNKYCLGKKLSDETKKKISIATKNRKKSPIGTRGKKYKFTYNDGRITINTIPELQQLGYHPSALRRLRDGVAYYHKNIVKVEKL